MQKRCINCGRYFIAARRIGEKQKVCGREACKRERKKRNGNRGLRLNVDKPALVIIIRNMTRPLRKDYEGAAYHIIW